MGLLVEGVWHDQWYNTKDNGGRFARAESQFRHGIAQNSGTDSPFVAEPDRYHLYVSYACPWAHRTLIARKLKGLESLISVSAVHPLMLDNGWTFEQDEHGATGDTLYGFDYAHQLYTKASADYSGRVTVPILWDKKTQTLVNNESSEILRIFNTAFNDLDATGGANSVDLYPEAHREEINELNAWIYPNINNGVYRAGFATTQAAYEEAVYPLFDALDALETRLTEQRFLIESGFTEADIRLFTTLIRFDSVYVSHFKCDLKRIADYPALSAYVRDIYQLPGVAETVNMHHIRNHYFRSHPTINPHAVMPVGPAFDLNQAPNRAHLKGELPNV